ncbi:MAG: tetrahydromethanopterin S-methyltransferase subunit H [Candidatus Bathyarchaeota archaeon]|nr:tetrahydromethanopterin S-methyltransferase subunit H [Candidatus Bathyarchaeota archaeon]
MFDYGVDQKTYEIFGVKIGGIPGLVPTVMVGSMFYKGHGIVEDPVKGLFDVGEAEKQIKDAEEMTDKTGLPSMLDLVAENSKAAFRYMDFVVDASKMPIMLDVVAEEDQVNVLQYAHDVGIMDRIVFNSLNPQTSDKVYAKIAEVGCTSATLLLHSSRYVLSSSKDALLDEMVPKAVQVGVEKILVDTVVLDIPTLGLAVKAIDRIKDRYGYPCGCGAHNAVSSWKNLRKKYTPSAVTTAVGVICALPVAAGADFVFYGPMRNAEAVYPSIAMINAAYSQLVMEQRIRLGKDHPRYKIG